MSRRRLFGSLLALVFLVNLARVVFAPLLEPLMSTFGIGPGTAGLIATLVWLGSAVPRIPTGYLLTRVPRHHVILGAGAVLTGASFAAAAAPSVALLAVAGFLMGAASGAYFIAAIPLVGELYPSRVGRAIGLHSAGGQLAAVAAAPLVGLFLLVGDYRAVFLSIGTAAVLATVALWRVARRTELPDAGNADRDLLAAVRAQWRLVLFGVVVLGTMGFVWNGVFNFYVTYLVDAKALAPATARNLLTVVFAAGVPAVWIAGRLADRLPRVPLMLALIGGFAVALLALTSVDSVLVLVVVSAAIGYLVTSVFPVIDTYLISSLPDEHRASAYAAFSGSVMLVESTGSAVLGGLTEAGLAFDTVFRGAAVGVIAVVLALSALYALGRLPRGRALPARGSRGD